MRRKFWNKRKKPKGTAWRVPRRYLAFTMLLIVAVVFVHSFYRFDRRILPMVLEAAELRIQAEINNIINYVIQEIVLERRVTAQDFLLKSTETEGIGSVLSVNTVLVNDICNTAAQRISERLNNLEPEIVSVPMALALGLDTLAQRGPRFSFTLAPIGNALVDYESGFTAVGINQIHFAVWLTVESVVRIINPVHSSEIIVMRNVSLVDTVISGTVPETYVNMDIPGLTLTP
ncbi:MAG: sporulation protein YunB [Firmicutes bacterium]|nr:sporulation protein YunB [Bacillota bacterium]